MQVPWPEKLENLLQNVRLKNLKLSKHLQFSLHLIDPRNRAQHTTRELSAAPGLLLDSEAGCRLVELKAADRQRIRAAGIAVFEDEHEASLIINQLQVTASSPAAAPEELNVSLKSASYGAAGKIDLKLDITTILTDVLDLVEMSENVVSY